MKEKKKSNVQQAIIISFAIIIAVLLSIVTYLYLRIGALENQPEPVSITYKDVADFFNECDKDFIDNVVIDEGRLCYDCNIMNSFENGMIQSSRSTICSKGVMENNK